MFGIGWAEMIILGLFGLVIFGGALFAVVFAYAAARNSKGAANWDEIAALRREIDRLREEVDRLKKGPDASTGITSSPR